MKAKLDNHHEITTDHPASHYGAGVLLIAGEKQAYGPGDDYPESLPKLRELLGVKNPFTCGDIVREMLSRPEPNQDEILAGVAAYPLKLSSAEKSLVNRWLSQEPAKN